MYADALRILLVSIEFLVPHIFFILVAVLLDVSSGFLLLEHLPFMTQFFHAP